MRRTIDLEFDFGSFTSSTRSLLPSGLSSNQSFNFNLFDLLLTIGRLTTPTPQYPWDWRSIYAILRYGWAISGVTNFQFTQDVKNVDFRLKTLMSEDFGIGFTGLIMREHFGCHFAAATSTIVHHRPRNTAIRIRATPDFIGLRHNGTRLIFESKGTQTSINHSNNQINNGKINQVQPFQRSHIFPGFVIGSFLSRTGSTFKSKIRIVDPNEKGDLSEEINNPSIGDIMESHFYRLLTFITGIPWPYEEWKEIGLRGLLEISEKSDNIYFKETQDGSWWYKTLSLPNIPNLAWLDSKVKTISVDIGFSNKVVELVENGSWNEVLEYAEEGGHLDSFFKEGEQETEKEIIWKNKYRDGMAVVVKLVYD